MKLLLQSTVILLLLVSCSGRRHVERNLHSGNYDYAINEALDRLRTNRDGKRKQNFMALLGDAFIRAVERDKSNIAHLKKDGNPEGHFIIYNTYIKLHNRQERIRPVLPLYYKGKPLDLRFENYDDQIIEYRHKASEYLYGKGLGLLDTDDKAVLREAYSVFRTIEDINPGFRDVPARMIEAYNKGTDYVLVNIKNDTFQVIPKRLEDDLLNFETYGLDDFWTAYHSNPNPEIDYDYSLQLLLRRINISPERIIERNVLRENRIVDGWEYEYDSDGNVKKDSLGNDIKVDKIINVRARLREYEQLKSTQIIANVDFFNNRNNQLLRSYPLQSEFVFSNIFATYRGDERALTKEDKQLIRNRQVYFPTNEQMIFDTGEDLKLKLKSIITGHNF